MTNSSEKAADDRTAGNLKRVPVPLAVLLVAALLLRIAAVMALGDDLRTDPDGYVGLAQSVAAGSGLSVPGSDRATAFRPPLLPLMIAVGIRIGLSGVAAVVLLNIAAGVITVAATWMLGRTLQLNGRWIFAAAAVPVFDPLLLRYTAIPMTEVPSAALATIAVWLFVRYQQSHEMKDGAGSGVAFGLAALCRPVLLVTGVLLAVIGATSRWRRWRITNGRFFRMILLSTVPAAAMAVTVAPWIVRNEVVFGKSIPATTHGGYTLLLGNNSVFFREVVDAPGQPVWSGQSLSEWQQDMNHQMTNDGVAPGDEIAADRWMYARAREEIHAQPGVFLKACLLRWKRFWGLSPATGSHGVPIDLAVGTWYAVLWIGLLGSLIPRGVRQRTDCIWLLWTAILSFLLLHTFYWTDTRMRAPLTGVLAVLAIVGYQNWLRLSSRLRRTTELSS
ncbi:MAG: glycosyltransferase family 39 protein [Planctomycetaceae bacterium]